MKYYKYKMAKSMFPVQDLAIFNFLRTIRMNIKLAKCGK